MDKNKTRSQSKTKSQYKIKSRNLKTKSQNPPPASPPLVVDSPVATPPATTSLIPAPGTDNSVAAPTLAATSNPVAARTSVLSGCAPGTIERRPSAYRFKVPRPPPNTVAPSRVPQSSSYSSRYNSTVLPPRRITTVTRWRPLALPHEKDGEDGVDVPGVADLANGAGDIDDAMAGSNIFIGKENGVNENSAADVVINVASSSVTGTNET
ncbi:hypothetical protein BD311DRAFT_865672 [Dichomitus squalens]|uniref:Uncharacterized protein n=1 Tax=Dichomitus squalens TaxID=114155 RepID=A0A4Q9MKJ4_9APHY|nr:hypothetical protein BD311DRAFT_865672 [Dichomitus squalens]